MRRQAPRSIRQELRQARNNPVVAGSTTRQGQSYQYQDNSNEIPQKIHIHSVLKTHHDVINQLSSQISNLEQRLNDLTEMMELRFQQVENSKN